MIFTLQHGQILTPSRKPRPNGMEGAKGLTERVSAIRLSKSLLPAKAWPRRDLRGFLALHMIVL